MTHNMDIEIIIFHSSLFHFSFFTYSVAVTDSANVRA